MIMHVTHKRAMFSKSAMGTEPTLEHGVPWTALTVVQIAMPADLTGPFCTKWKERESHEGGKPGMSIRKYKTEQFSPALFPLQAVGSTSRITSGTSSPAKV